MCYYKELFDAENLAQCRQWENDHRIRQALSERRELKPTDEEIIAKFQREANKWKTWKSQ